MPKVIGSDNGPAFVSKGSQGLAETLGTNWKLHCVYRPLSSGQVKKINRTLKEIFTKLTFGDWLRLVGAPPLSPVFKLLSPTILT